MNRSFAYFWCARGASTLASQMLTVAVGWQIYDLTRSAFALGMIGLVQFIPTFLLVIASGHVADRYDRRYVASACQLFQGIVTIGIVVAVVEHAIAPAFLFGSVLAAGIGRAFEQPSVAALLPNLVPRSELQRATANSTSAANVAQIAGPAIGGLLYALGPAVVYGTVAGLLIVASVLLPMTRPVSREVNRAPQTIRTLFAGVSFVKNDRVVLGAISLDLFAVLMGGATALLPIYARDILDTGPWGLGLLRSAPAAGALLMTIAMGFFPLRRRVGPTLFLTVAAYGVVTVVFALSHSFVLSFLALATAGLFDAVSRVIRATLVQLETPDDVRGRVNAVNTMFTNSAGQLGQVESGLVAAVAGAVPSAVIGGIGSIVIALLWMGLFPEILGIDVFDRSALPRRSPAT